ncbi:MAG: co-chaperone GroES [Clostridia bacterium]|nr:co-chaperone GroES [Clostridia bacterium]
MNLKPLFDRVVLKPIQKENKTKSGIFIPEVSNDEPILAEVVAVGNGENFDGKKNEMLVKIHDKVLYNKYGAVEFREDDEVFAVVRQSDIFGIVEVK